jgi:hypothetical protein
LKHTEKSNLLEKDLPISPRFENQNSLSENSFSKIDSTIKPETLFKNISVRLNLYFPGLPGNYSKIQPGNDFAYKCKYGDERRIALINAIKSILRYNEIEKSKEESVNKGIIK